jgi:hypothetical protein
MLMLSACSQSSDPAPDPFTVPSLPADLATVPPRATLKVGDDARVALARTRATLAQCRDQYTSFKGHYNRLRKLSQKPSGPGNG